MRTLLAVVCVVLLCTWLGNAVPAKEKPKGAPLSGAELKKTLTSGSGVILDGRGREGLFSSVLLPDGSAYIQKIEAGPRVLWDKGSWRVAGDSLCVKLDLRYGVETCHKHYQTGDNVYESWTMEGYLQFSYSLRCWGCIPLGKRS